MKTNLTLGQSDELVSMGVDPEAASLCSVKREADGKLEYVTMLRNECFDKNKNPDAMPIFSLEDLLTLLPISIGRTNLIIRADERGWFVGYEDDRGSKILQVTKFQLIDALHELLICCVTIGHRTL